MRAKPRSRHASGEPYLSQQHEAAQHGIGSAINECTHSLHTQLNKLIIERLALGLPPVTNSPRLYATGLEAFANVYFAFELEWRHLTSNFSDESRDYQKKSTSSFDERVHGIERLSQLRPYGLERTTALQRDLDYLYGVIHPLNDKSPAASDGEVPQRKQQRLHAIGPIENGYIAHIHRTVSEKPHLLLAYAWVMYLAIFSGGRWIRAQLKAAGYEFWRRQPNVGGLTTSPNQYSGFEFLCFADGSDGENIRRDFKSRVASASEHLTLTERAEILDEAKLIFKSMIALVNELDRSVLSALSEHPMGEPNSIPIAYDSVGIHIEAPGGATTKMIKFLAPSWRKVFPLNSTNLGWLLFVFAIIGIFMPQLL